MKETIPAALDGQRVDRVVAMLADLPRSEVDKLLVAGGVAVNGATVRTKSTRLAEGDRLVVNLAAPPVTAIEADRAVDVRIVHADADVIVVDKQAGLVVHPGAGHHTGTLVNGLLARFPDLASAGHPDRPGIVHRLDAGTTGLLVVARTPAAYAGLVGQLAARTVERRYLALVLGHLEGPAGLIDAPVGRSTRDRTRMAVSHDGREARTTYEVVHRYDQPLAATFVECRLESGRTHQIRVHMSSIGHPLAGDARYRGYRRELGLDRPFLHAHALSFVHPASGETVRFSSALPDDLERVRGRFS